MLFHGKEDLVKAFFTDTLLKTAVRKKIKELRDGRIKSVLLPPNLRMYPQEESLEEAAFRFHVWGSA